MASRVTWQAPQGGRWGGPSVSSENPGAGVFRALQDGLKGRWAQTSFLLAEVDITILKRVLGGVQHGHVTVLPAVRPSSRTFSWHGKETAHALGGHSRSSLPPAPAAASAGLSLWTHLSWTLPVPGLTRDGPFTPASFTDCHVFTAALRLEKREVAAQGVFRWWPGRGRAGTASHVLGKSQSPGRVALPTSQRGASLSTPHSVFLKK